MPFFKTLSLAASATVLPGSVHADASDSVARRRPLELGAAVTFGISNVANSTFHATRADGSKVSASGADFGYERPSVLGFEAHGAYFPLERLGLGLYLGAGWGWGASAGSAIATETRPAYFDVMSFGALTQIVVIDGPLSLRVGGCMGVRLEGIVLNSPAFDRSYIDKNGFSRRGHGGAIAVDLVASPRATLIQRFGTNGELGAFWGPDFMTTAAAGSAWTSGVMIALR
jgi:hypothetical protein